MSSQKPVTFSGSLELRGMGYSADGIPSRRNPFTWYLFGSPTISVYGITIPFTFALSEEEKTYSQPFNRYGLSPRYKWITLHLGYRNLNFSPYTLGGHTLYGAGIELTPGAFRFGAAYGRLNKATELDTNLGYVRPVSFTRKVYAVKTGIGRKGSFIDFSFLKAMDDSGSVSYQGTDTATFVHPAANMAASAAMRLQFSPKLVLEADGGLSLYTHNMRSVNPIKELDLYKHILPVNLSTEKYMAWSAALTYKQKHFSLKTNYKWVEPGFKSMGVYYFNNDLEQITFAPSCQLFKNRLRISGSLGLQHDNLRGQKAMSTDRTIWSANAGMDFTRKLGLDLNLSNYSMSATPQVTLVNQKYKLTNTSRTYAASPRFIHVTKTNSHSVLGNVTLAEMTDANDSTTALNTIRTQMAFISYNLGFQQHNLNFTFTANTSSTEFRSNQTRYTGFGLGINKGFYSNKLQIGSNAAFTTSKSQTGSDILNLSLQLQYSINKHHRLHLRWVMTGNRPVDTELAPAYTENTGEIGYHFSF